MERNGEVKTALLKAANANSPSLMTTQNNGLQLWWSLSELSNDHLT